MSPILKVILSFLVLAAGASFYLWFRKNPNNIILALSIILALAGAFFSTVSCAQLIKK